MPGRHSVRDISISFAEKGPGQDHTLNPKPFTVSSKLPCNAGSVLATSRWEGKNPFPVRVLQPWCEPGDVGNLDKQTSLFSRPLLSADHASYILRVNRKTRTTPPGGALGL